MRIVHRFPRAGAALFALALLVSLARPAVRAQQAPAQLPPLDAQAVLPIDPAIRTGTLPNGLKYYIRRNGRPEKRVSLRLAVKIRVDRGSRRSAGPCAPYRAHGVQRERPLQAG